MLTFLTVKEINVWFIISITRQQSELPFLMPCSKNPSASNL